MECREREESFVLSQQVAFFSHTSFDHPAAPDLQFTSDSFWQYQHTYHVQLGAFSPDRHILQLDSPQCRTLLLWYLRCTIHKLARPIFQSTAKHKVIQCNEYRFGEGENEDTCGLTVHPECSACLEPVLTPLLALTERCSETMGSASRWSIQEGMY